MGTDVTLQVPGDSVCNANESDREEKGREERRKRARARARDLAFVLFIKQGLGN
jgi:hypothetical protein